MPKEFAEALKDAQGRSEFVIVVVIDIRGFSRFSTQHESPNVAMFIKRFYLRLINDYFPNATFVKPTGDGLLMTFMYDENTLKDVSREVVEACLRCLVDFPTLCKDDPMINFSLPDAIGIGVARGTACCLFSGQETLDYSGHLLNLTSRLNDLARPSGIVIDGAFLESVLPESCKADFKTQLVYVRSIAEEKPVPVFYLAKYVQIPQTALVPLAAETWKSINLEFTYAKLAKLASGGLRVPLPGPTSADKIRVTFIYPRKDLRGTFRFNSFKHFDYINEGIQGVVLLHIQKAVELLATAKLGPGAKAKFRIDFVPKPLPRS